MPKKNPGTGPWNEFGMINQIASYRRISVRKLGGFHRVFPVVKNQTVLYNNIRRLK